MAPAFRNTSESRGIKAWQASQQMMKLLASHRSKDGAGHGRQDEEDETAAGQERG